MSTSALRELETTLYWLRWCAVGGQAISLLFAAQSLGLDLPWPRLLGGIAALVAVNGLISWLRRRSAPSEARVLAGLGVDLATLTWALFHSGGVMNPFTMLYLLPVALTATIMPPTRVLAMALAGIGGYTVLALWAPSIPHLHGQGALDLHLAGMAVNFLISMSVLCAFGLYLARLLRQHAAALQESRERSLRDESMHALALQAAMAAHSMNTPLGTMSLLVDELRAVPSSGEALQSDLDVLAGQLALTRDALRGIVNAARADAQIAESLSSAMSSLANRAALLRPSVALAVELPEGLADRRVRMSPVLLASLGNLLDNAADASMDEPASGIRLVAEDHGDWLHLRVLDRGVYPEHAPPPGATSKQGGLGWGLTLANATLERCGGTLHHRGRETGGSEFLVRLPWRAIEAD